MMQFLDYFLNKMDSILLNLDSKNLEFEIMDAILDASCKAWSHDVIYGLHLGRFMHNMGHSLDDSCKTWTVFLDVYCKSWAALVKKVDGCFMRKRKERSVSHD